MMKRLIKRKIRHLRVRKNVTGTKERPRLSVFRSSKHIYAQVIDDKENKTLASFSDLQLKTASKSDKAYEVGKKIAEKALAAGVKSVIYDRGGYAYHGRVAKLAEGAREGGLKF